MRPGISIILSPADRRRLEALVGDRNVAQKHVWRARIVLHSADGIGTNGIMRRTGKSKTCVWRWQERFAQEGYDGLLRDKTRPSRIPPLGPEVAERVVALTLSDPPAEATHWVAAMMAKATGISVSSVQRIWRAHGLRPHRVRQFKLSNDPDFVAKLRDVVGLYVDPPAHAIVLSVDEKSQIQALDRTQPGLPMKKGRLGTMTHDYKRHGTTTLFAALNVLEGKVIGRCMQRHRHQEFIRFLNAIEADIPLASVAPWWGAFCVTESGMTALRPFQRRFIAAATAPGIDTAILSGPRGLGKSWIAAHLITRALTPGDPLHVTGGEVVIVAASIEQGRIPFRFARDALEPRGGYRFLDSATRIGIVHKATHTRVRVLGSNAKAAFGFVGVPLVVADEPGAYETIAGQMMFDAIETAKGKPGSPLRAVYIGTLAPATSGWWYDLVNDGTHGSTYVQALQGDPERWDQWARYGAAIP